MHADAVFLDEIFVSLQGEGGEIGRPHVFLRLAGCPLRCTYCDTPRSWVRRPSFERHLGAATTTGANPLGADALQRELEALCVHHGLAPRRTVLAVTGGEPLEQADFLAGWLPRWPGRVLLETAGVMPERLARLLPEVEIVSLDWKLPSMLRAGADLCDPLGCVQVVAGAARATEWWIKIVVAATTPDAELAHALRATAGAAPGARVFLQPATPFGAGPNPPSAERLLAWVAEHEPLGLDLRVVPQMHPVLGAR